jgi:hypothetical protein
MLHSLEDIDYNEVVCAAWELLEYVINEYNVKTFDDIKCPHFKALAKELYREE